MANEIALLLGPLLVVAAGTYLGVLGALRTYFGVEPPFEGAEPSSGADGAGPSGPSSGGADGGVAGAGRSPGTDDGTADER